MSSSWKNAADSFKRDQAKPPPGCQTIAQIAEEVNLSEERTRDMLTSLVRVGRAEIVRGKSLSITGTLVPTTYYRLLKAVPVAKTAKSKKDSNFDRG
jgi:hypothetical protein